MNKKFLALGVAAAITVSACTGLTACAEQKSESYIEYFSAMGGAVAALTIPKSKISNTAFYALADRVGSFLTATENSISSTLSTSYIFKFNLAEAGATVELDETSYEVLSLSKTLYEDTGGYFNPAVWYSSDLYGFSTHSAAELANAPYAREPQKDNDGNTFYPLPEAKYVTAFRQLSTYFGGLDLRQSDGKYYAVKPSETVTVDGDETEYSLRVDLGGIGKGWCADRVNQMLDEAGVKYGSFSFSGSSMSLKKYEGNKSQTYTVVSRDPRGAATSGYATVSLNDVNLSTSGDNMQYYIIDGVRYCHIIDPMTGSPIQTGVASVFVAGGSAAEDDALTTALAAMGKQTAVDFINDRLTDKIVMMLVFKDGRGEIITNRPDKINVVGAYSIGNTIENGNIVLK